MVVSSDPYGSFLSRQQIDRFWADGVIHPLTAISEDEAAALVPQFEMLQQRMANWVNIKQLPKVHLVSKWVCELITNPRILDAVESLIGPNILVWGATFFAKQPENTAHVGWHQDLTYWGLEPADSVVTVWLGLTDARADNGAMQVIVGSHKQGLRRHENKYDDSNMLMNSQNCALVPEDAENKVMVELSAVQFSIHHSLALHGSGPNLSSRPRIGLSVNLISTQVVQHINGGVDAASLLRGVDEYGHFELDELPQLDFSPQALACYRKSIQMPSGIATIEGSAVNFENIA